MIRILCIVVLMLSTSVWAQDDTVRFADATQEKALVDEYLASYTAQSKPLVTEIKLLKRLFDSYDREVYQQTLLYLQSFAAQQPEAVLALSDSIQTYWDSHYLQSFISGSSAEYGKLKFLSALGMAAGGIGLLKNPLASFSTLKHLNLLLPIAGGVGTYYAVNFFQVSDIPPEPQEILSLAQGKRYFAYQQKRNDYLYRLFSVGTGIGTGQLAFNVLTNNSDEVYKILKPKLNPRYLKGAAGALLAYFAVQQGSYYVLRYAEVKQKENKFKKSLQDLYSAVSAGDKGQTINAAQQLAITTTQLVTLYEMQHLHTMVEFEQELSKKAAQQAGSDEGVREKIEQITTQLSKSLQIKTKDYERGTPEQSHRTAKAELDGGKLHKNFALLWQTAMVFKTLGEDEQLVFLQHFHHKMLAKYNNMLLMYKNFSKVVEHNQLWKVKFTAEELQAALAVYLDYHQADSRQTALLTQYGINKEVLTSTRSFARFLAKEIVQLKAVKDFNAIMLHMLDTYQHEAQHREALAILMQDIDEQAELHDSFYDSVVTDGIKGAFAGMFALMGVAGVTNLLQKLGMDNSKRPLRWLAKLLSFENGKQWNFAGLPTNLKALKRLGVVGVAGAGIGVLMYHLNKLRTHKLPPQQALLDTQKLVAVDIAYQTCQLQHDIEASKKDQAALQAYSVEQIEAERDVHMALLKRFDKLATQVNHLHSVAPSLRINHVLDAELEARIKPQTSACTTQEVSAVSITPLTEDLRRASKMLRERKNILDSIDKQRLSQAIGG